MVLVTFRISKGKVLHIHSCRTQCGNNVSLTLSFSLSVQYLLESALLYSITSIDVYLGSCSICLAFVSLTVFFFSTKTLYMYLLTLYIQFLLFLPEPTVIVNLKIN